MSKPGVHVKVAAVENPWVRLPGDRLPGARSRARRDAIGDRICAVLIVGVVVALLLAWLALGASYVRELQQDGMAALPRIGAIAVQHPDLAAAQAGGDTGGIDIAAWTPIWIGVDMLIFVALGVFLRCDGRRK